MLQAVTAPLQTCQFGYIWASLLIYLFEVLLRPLSKKFWVRYYYIFLLLVVFAPYMLVRLHRKIKQLCKLVLIYGTRTRVLPYHTPYDHRAALSGLCFAGAEHAELPFTNHILWPYLICFSVFHCPAINHEFLASQSFNQYIKYQIR